MHCERAQEFFSDYLEHTLDRPMIVALEAHLHGCAHCSEDLGALQSTFAVLNQVPAAEPPPDGVWQVLSRLEAQQPVAAAIPVRIPAGVRLLQWLRALNPAGVAMGAGLATLIVGGMWLATGIPHQQLNLGDHLLDPVPGQRATVPGSLSSTVQVTCGPITEAGRQVNLRVVPAGKIPDAHVKVMGEGLNLNWAGNGMMSPTKPALLSIPLPSGPAMGTLWITVDAPSSGQKYRHLVLVPLKAPREPSVTLVLDRQPLGEALSRLAASLDRPVVVDGVSEAAVSLAMENATPVQCLEEIAAQAGAVLRKEQSTYRLSPAQ